MVKKLDLLESNHGLRAERTIQGKAFQNGRNTTLHGPHLTRNVFPKRFGAWRTSPMVSARRVFCVLAIVRAWPLRSTLHLADVVARAVHSSCHASIGPGMPAAMAGFSHSFRRRRIPGAMLRATGWSIY